MDAITLLRSIVEDGYLSESNAARARELLDKAFPKDLTPDLVAILEDCRAQYARGDGVAAVKRYRMAAKCGLRAAHDAVAMRPSATIG